MVDIHKRKFNCLIIFAEMLHNLNKNNELELIYIGIINYSLEILKFTKTIAI